METRNSQNLINIQFCYETADPSEFTYPSAPMAGWYELFYLIQGKLHFSLQDRTSFLLPEDSLVLIPANTPARCFAVNEEPLEYLRVRFHSNLLAAERQKTLLGLFNDNMLQKENYYTEISDSELQLFLHVFLTSRGGDESLLQLFYALAVENILAWLVLYERRDAPAPPPERQTYSRPTSTILDYVRCHLCEPISISNITELLYWDEIYIQKKFKQEVGISLHDYIIREKISLARAYINAGGHPDSPRYMLAEIARKTGFSTYSTFYRNFVKVTGHSPIDELKQAPSDPQIPT